MSMFRPAIVSMSGYTPGEQPQGPGWIKLNTNENPYPPSPKVVEAIAATARAGRLNLYPDPLGTRFREVVGQVYGVDPDGVIPGNGSDEILTILTRTYLDSGDRMAIPYPSYILYETLSQLQGATCERILLEPDWSFHPQRTAEVVQRSRLIFAPNPNSPSGNFWTDDELALLVPERGALILDGAYADFVDPRMGIGLLMSEYGDRIVLTRTLSKSYSLAGIRFGFAMAQPEVVAQMRKVKDSYNCDALSLAAATAAIEDQAWMLENARKIRATRSRLAEGLAALGFVVVPSEANFVWCGHPGQNHRSLYERLKAERILVRYMVYRDVPWGLEQTLDGLRITVGTDLEIDALLLALQRLV